MPDMPAEAMLALLRLYELSEGADVCDRCGDIIWPELELVRCDFCVGEHGPANESAIREAMVRHHGRIRAFEREEYEDHR